MKIYKWVPISTLDQVCKKIISAKKIMLIKANNYKSKCFNLQKKKSKTVSDKENGLPRKGVDSSNSNFGLTEDSNTCKFGFNSWHLRETRYYC